MWWLSRRRMPDPLIDELIAQKGVVRVKYDDFDPALRERSEWRRQQAEKQRRAAQRIESGGPGFLRVAK